MIFVVKIQTSADHMDLGRSDTTCNPAWLDRCGITGRSRQQGIFPIIVILAIVLLAVPIKCEDHFPVRPKMVDQASVDYALQLSDWTRKRILDMGGFAIFNASVGRIACKDGRLPALAPFKGVDGTLAVDVFCAPNRIPGVERFGIADFSDPDTDGRVPYPSELGTGKPELRHHR